MSEKKIGRPVVGNKKDVMFRMRIDKETLDHLDKFCKKENVSRSEAIRRMIQKLEI